MFFCYPLPANFVRYIDASSLKESIKTVKYNEGGTWTAKAMQEALITYRDKMRDDSKTARVSLKRSKAEKQTICETK